MVNSLRQFGAVFGIAIVTAVFNSAGSLAGPASVTAGFRPALAAGAGFSAVGAAVAVAVRRRTYPSSGAGEVTGATAADPAPAVDSR